MAWKCESLKNKKCIHIFWTQQQLSWKRLRIKVGLGGRKMIDKKLIEVIGNPFYTGVLTMEELQEITGYSKKKIQTELTVINRYSNSEIKDLKGECQLNLTELNRVQLIADFNKTKIINEEQRLKIIYLMLFTGEEVHSIYCFEDLLKISRNTALSDIKKIKEKIKTFQLEIVYERSKGYFIQGDEQKIRAVALNYIFQLFKDIDIKTLVFDLFNLETEIKLLKDKLLYSSRKYDISLMIGQVGEVSCFIYLLAFRNKNYDESLSNELVVFLEVNQQMTQFCELSLEGFDFSDEDKKYISYLLAGISQRSYLEDDTRCKKIFNDFLLMFQSVSANQIINDQQLNRRLYEHFVPMLYREKYFLFLDNPIIEKYMDKYRELFLLVKKALHFLTPYIGHEISDTEVGLIVVNIESLLANKRKPLYSIPKALIICPNGTSSSIILKEELKKIFPTIQFIRTTSVSDFLSQTNKNYDLIFSTVPIETEEKIYIVPPLLSDEEQLYIKRRVEKDFDLPVMTFPEEQELKKILEKKCRLSDQDLEEIAADLFKLMTDNRSRGESPMLSELMTKEMIQFSDEKLSWQEAIIKCAEPMVNKQYVEPSYVTAMIEKVKEFGAFINIGPNFALPHARPEDGVNETSMSLLKLSEPTYLLDDEKHPVKMFISLASIDNEQHLKALATLTRILSDSEQFTKLMNAENSDEIITIIKQGEM